MSPLPWELLMEGHRLTCARVSQLHERRKVQPRPDILWWLLYPRYVSLVSPSRVLLTSEPLVQAIQQRSRRSRMPSVSGLRAPSGRSSSGTRASSAPSAPGLRTSSQTRVRTGEATLARRSWLMGPSCCRIRTATRWRVQSSEKPLDDDFFVNSCAARRKERG